MSYDSLKVGIDQVPEPSEMMGACHLTQLHDFDDCLSHGGFNSYTVPA